MNGEEAVVLALKKYADRIYGIPGYPVTGIVEKTGAELVVNEKTALEYAIGDSLSGRRAAVIAKQVGVNALADPLSNATFQGLKRGVLIVAGDDTTGQNSQTVQDSRFYGPVAQIPVTEPEQNKGISKNDVSEAFYRSEKYSRVSMLRLTPEILKSPAFKEPSTDKKPTIIGKLADKNLTMHGRAVAASKLTAEFSDTKTQVTGNLPEKRTERGHVTSLCMECPYRPLFEMLAEKKISVICDTGCSLIAMNQPYSFGIASYGMGSSVAVAAKSTGVALTGDFGLLHSGISALIDVYEKQIPLLCIVMKNRCMGMTGGQPAYDPVDYIRFSEPVVCSAKDTEKYEALLKTPKKPVTLVIEGLCPEVIHHETYKC